MTCYECHNLRKENDGLVQHLRTHPNTPLVTGCGPRLRSLLSPPSPAAPVLDPPPRLLCTSPPLSQEFLSKALQPPDRRAVHNAKMLLKAIGALDAFERLTPLGEHLAHLPVDPLVGKMILMGAVFSCLDPVLTIAAGLAHRDPWVIPLER